MKHDAETYEPKGIIPTKEQAAYANDLLRRLGQTRAAKRTGLSRTALNNVARGGYAHRGTLAVIDDCMAAEPAS